MQTNRALLVYADRNAEQKSKDPVISDVKTSESESDNTVHTKSQRVSSAESEHKLQAPSDSENSPVPRNQTIRTNTKSSSSIDRAPPGKVGTIFVKVVSDNQIDLKWTGIKGPDFDHYNVYMVTKSSLKVSSSVTVPIGTSNTNSYSSTRLIPSTTYYYNIGL